jgi:outer membrane biosynthesis protein TonB
VGSVLVPFAFLGPWKEGEGEPEPEPEPEPTP